MRRLDREDRNLRAAVDWALANDEPDLGLRIVGGIWRWFQQRGRIREAARPADRAARPPAAGDVRVRIAGLAAEGGLAYWMDDFPAPGRAYEERLALAEATGDPVLLADAHYDLGFLSMVAKDAEGLRAARAARARRVPGGRREEGATRARQAIVLAPFLAGDYAAAPSSSRSRDRGLPPDRLAHRGRGLADPAVGDPVPARPTRDGLARDVRGAQVLRGQQGTSGMARAMVDGGHHPTSSTATPSSGRGSPARPTSCPRAERDARPGQGPPPARSGRPGGRSTRRGAHRRAPGDRGGDAARGRHRRGPRGSPRRACRPPSPGVDATV